MNKEGIQPFCFVLNIGFHKRRTQDPEPSLSTDPAPLLPSYTHINDTGILFHLFLEFCFCTPPPCPTLENKSWSLHPGSFQDGCGEKIFRIKERIAFSDGEFQILSVIEAQTNQVSHVPGSLWGTVFFGIFLNFSSKWLLGIFSTPTGDHKGELLPFLFSHWTQKNKHQGLYTSVTLLQGG